MKMLENAGNTEMPPPPVCGIFGEDIARRCLNKRRILEEASRASA